MSHDFSIFQTLLCPYFYRASAIFPRILTTTVQTFVSSYVLKTLEFQIKIIYERDWVKR